MASDENGLHGAVSNGSLEAKTVELFEQAGLHITRVPRRHVAIVGHPLVQEVVFMRPQHIPWAVAEGKFDVGICGLDCVEESGVAVSVEALLPYSRRTSGPARVVLVVAADNNADSVSCGATVLSEYPRITSKWLKGLRPPVSGVTIVPSVGSTEAMVPELAPYGVCLVETGESLAQNNLRIAATLLETTTVLISNIHASEGLVREKGQLVTHLRRLLLGTLEAREQAMLVMNVPVEKEGVVLGVFPAMKQPTVIGLAGGKYVSISAAVSRAEVVDIFQVVLEAGAEDVLELPITRMIRHK